MNPPYGPPPAGNDAVPTLPGTRSRFFDLLEQLRAEFDAAAEENRSYHGLREEYQRKVEKQVAELALMEQSLAELDRKHLAMKERYEADIARLQASAAGAAATVSVSVSLPHAHAHAHAHAPAPTPSTSTPLGAPGHPAPSGTPLPQTHSVAITPQELHHHQQQQHHQHQQQHQHHHQHHLHHQQQQQQQLQQQHASAVNPSLVDLTGGPQARGRASLGPSQPPPPPPPSSLIDPNSATSIHGPPHIQGHKNQGHGSGGMSRDPVSVNHDMPNGANGLSNIGPPGPVSKRLAQLPSAPHGFGPIVHPTGDVGPGYPNAPSQTSPSLVGISSLPSTTHTPAMPSVGANGHRLLSTVETGGMKKDNASRPMGNQLLMSNEMVGVPAGIAPGAQQAGDEDYVVYHGRAPNGSMVNMKVSLQNSLPHDSVVCCVRYSWDGDYLATGSNRSAHIFDINSGQKVAVFAKDDGTDASDGTAADSYVRAVCFSRDGNWLITGAEDHVVKVWDVRNRTVKHKLIGHDTDIYSVDASANGAFVISGSGDKKAKLWSLETGKLLSTLGGEYGPTDGITSVSISPTSQHVAAGSLDKMVRVWDVETSRLARQFEGHRDSVYSVAFSPDGVLLLSGSLDKTLKLWDLSASRMADQCRLTFSGHKDFVLSVCFSPDGRWLISGSKDRTVQFWDPRQPTMCVMLQGHKNSVISIAHNPASMSLATGSGDCRARVWNFGHA